MKKQFIKIIGLLAVCGLAFASCQEEDEITAEVDQPQNIIYKEYSFEEVHPDYVEVPKKSIPTPPISSTILDTYSGIFKSYNTKILGDQEWMTEYWNNPNVDGLPNTQAGAYASPNYPEKGQYYIWELLSGTSQGFIDNEIFRFHSGCHFPTVADIGKLVDYLGSKTYIASHLELSSYNDYYWSGGWNSSNDNAIYFWVGDPNHVFGHSSGCGVFLKVKNGSVSYVCTNMTDICIRAIFVRNA